jgi:hypothetical protein
MAPAQRTKRDAQSTPDRCRIEALSTLQSSIRCARMTAFLLVIGELTEHREKCCFPLVKSLRFETKSDALKSLISESSVGAK